MPTVVRRKPGQSDDKLISDFRKKVLADEVLLELKKREFYKKPSLVKQEKAKERRANRYVKRRSY
ncbi:MAG: 30S ribosomal protein S21 [Patescibacteria group bacterium]